MSGFKVHILYAQRSKLYRFEDGGWKGCCPGHALLVRHKVTGRVRFLYQEKPSKMVAYHFVDQAPYCELQPKDGSDRCWTWLSQDYLLCDSVMLPLALKFATAELAQKFKDMFNRAKDINVTTMGTGRDVLKPLGHWFGAYNSSRRTRNCFRHHFLSRERGVDSPPEGETTQRPETWITCRQPGSHCVTALSPAWSSTTQPSLAGLTHHTHLGHAWYSGGTQIPLEPGVSPAGPETMQHSLCGGTNISSTEDCEEVRLLFPWHSSHGLWPAQNGSKYGGDPSEVREMERTSAVPSNAQRITDLGASIEELTAKSASLGTDIEELKKQVEASPTDVQWSDWPIDTTVAGYTDASWTEQVQLLFPWHTRPREWAHRYEMSDLGDEPRGQEAECQSRSANEKYLATCEQNRFGFENDGEEEELASSGEKMFVRSERRENWSHDGIEALLELEGMQALLKRVPKDDQGNDCSVGSIPHATGACKPCAFAQNGYYHKQREACQKGVECLFCHLPHAPKKRVKLSNRKMEMKRSGAVTEPSVSTVSSPSRTRKLTL